MLIFDFVEECLNIASCHSLDVTNSRICASQQTIFAAPRKELREPMDFLGSQMTLYGVSEILRCLPTCCSSMFVVTR